MSAQCEITAKLAANAPMSVFERYLTVWVFLCIVAGIALGQLLPGVFQAIGRMEVAKVNLPVGLLIWVMIIPMLVKVDFGALHEVRQHMRGIGVTLFVNWLVKPFSMAFLGWLFIRHLFAPLLPPDQLDSYIAGLILLAAAPCTAMVFVWSRLTGGDPLFTLSQVALNDGIMIVAFAPLVAFLLGISAITVPWDTLLTSVVLYIVIPVILAQLWRKALLAKGQAAFDAAMEKVGPWSISALLATLVLLFAFQGEAILRQPLIIALLAVPILIQVFFNSGARLLAEPRRGREAQHRLPVGADRSLELLRAGRGRRHQPVRLQLRRRAGHGGGGADRGAGDAAGRQDRQQLQRLVRTRFARRENHPMSDVTIYHNPKCGTSRNVLALIRNAGIEPQVIEYLETPPSRAELVTLIAATGAPLRDAIRAKEAIYTELNLADPALSDDALIDAMLAHPILINRPLVVTPLGTRLCRPSEAVLDLLPAPQQGPFAKEDGEVVIDAPGTTRQGLIPEKYESK